MTTLNDIKRMFSSELVIDKIDRSEYDGCVACVNTNCEGKPLGGYLRGFYFNRKCLSFIRNPSAVMIVTAHLGSKNYSFKVRDEDVR